LARVSVADLAAGLWQAVPMPQRYVFRSEWRINAPPDEVYTALADVESYPTWWRQVRSARWLDQRSGELVCRSLLPYDLTFVIERDVEDPAGRVLRGRLTGDLNGESQWTITGTDGRSVAVFDEEVSVGRGMVQAAGLVARPALTFNHGLMMRSGEAGLRRLLAR
jgi:Polyketide cyclase / dehydrase and lipid transport